MPIACKDNTTIVGVDSAELRDAVEGQERLLGRHDLNGRPYGGRSSIKKRSVLIDGRKSSVSLENEFWQEVKILARARGLTVQELVADVVARYNGHNVSSALRVEVLEHFRQSK